MGMIRLLILSAGLVSATVAVMLALGSDPATGRSDEVSRAAPDAFALNPALAPAGGVVTPRPAAQAAVPTSTDAAAQTRPVARPAIPAPSTEAQPRIQALADQPVTAPQEDVMQTLRAMSYGIVHELQKPVAGAEPAPAVVTARAEPQPQAVAGRTYTVQKGDSLPGIAFRFYGTTVAYLQILSANQDVLPDPSKLEAGMVLRIPD